MKRKKGFKWGQKRELISNAAFSILQRELKGGKTTVAMATVEDLRQEAARRLKIRISSLEVVNAARKDARMRYVQSGRTESICLLSEVAREIIIRHLENKSSRRHAA
ncbi:MAG TPA: hypothetical protein PKA31_02910 [Candidatus Moranbacteria bacterium]|nr:hypothetical protein [Candidatus Moranbacteria bacterium]